MRKRFAILIIAGLTMLFGTTYADEILFRGLPWGTDIDTFKKSFNASPWSGVEDEEAQLIAWNEHRNNSSRMIFDLKSSSILPSGWSYTTFSFDGSPLVVAGYNVAALDGYFYYGVDGDTVIKDRASTRLYMAEYVFDVLDIDGAFQDLKTKLTSLYGTGETKLSEGTAYNSETWKEIVYPVEKYIIFGDNDTSVLLEKGIIDSSGYVLLAYGQGEDDSEIKKIQNLSFIKKLHDEQNNRTDSNDGL